MFENGQKTRSNLCHIITCVISWTAKIRKQYFNKNHFLFEYLEALSSGKYRTWRFLNQIQGRVVFEVELWDIYKNLSTCRRGYLRCSLLCLPHQFIEVARFGEAHWSRYHFEFWLGYVCSLQKYLICLGSKYLICSAVIFSKIVTLKKKTFFFNDTIINTDKRYFRSNIIIKCLIKLCIKAFAN
jgi:hypothetical protein